MANTVNGTGKSFAKGKIASGDVDKTSSWSFSTSDGNALLGPNGDDWTNYGKWHLGIDASADSKTKAHWKYPFGKGGKVYRSGIIAIKQRAGGNNDAEILSAADDLLELIDGNEEPSENDMTDIFPFKASNNKTILRINAKNNSDTMQMDMFGVVGGGFWSDGGITKETFAKALKDIPSSCKRVDMRMSSPGGDVFEGRAIANMMQDHRCAFDINIIAEACSIASIIAMAGDSIHMGDGSVMLVHRCYTMAMGNSQEMKKLATDLELIDQTMVQTYKKKTGMSEKDILNLMDENRYMDAQEAKKLGFADTIANDSVTNASSLLRIAAMDIDRSKFHLPPLPKDSQPRRLAALSAIARIRNSTPAR